MGSLGVDLSALENLRVAAVQQALDEVLSEEIARGRSICTCQLCLLDMGAIALNSLPPQYVTDPWLKFAQSPDVTRAEHEKVRTAVRQAIETVGERPHHDR
jgi:competence protein ComFB